MEHTGVIIPKRNAAQVNSTVFKASAGALTQMRVARVTNIRDCIKKLKDEGLWIVSTEISAETKYYEQDFNMPVAVLIGNEEKGVSQLLKEESDFNITIPMKGDFNSLNASVSAGIIMFEILKQRNIYG